METPWISGLSLLVLAQLVSAQTTPVDPTFDPGTGAENGFIESVVVQNDSKILVAGNFTSFNGTPQGYVARLQRDGALDPAFKSYVGYWVRTMAIQPDGKIFIGGWFTDVQGISRNRIARLNSNGLLDTTFDPGSGCEQKLVPPDPNDPFVFAMALQPDGKLIIGGNFVTYNGTVCNGLCRVNSDGSLDTTFNVGSGVDSWVRSMKLLPNGQVLVTGWFTQYKNQGHNRLMLLNSDGSPVDSFNPYFGDSTSIYTVSPLPDGRIIAAGHSVNPDAPFRQEVVRLNLDGSYDASFNPGGEGANDKVETTLLAADGKVFIGGYFSLYNGIPQSGFSRLNSDGSLDSSFPAPQLDNWVWDSCFQNSKILVSGSFATVDGFPRSGIVRLITDSIPPLRAPVVSNCILNQGVFSISVATAPGHSYCLQFKELLVGGTWTSLPSVAGDGTEMTLADPNASANARFYRVVMDP